MMHELTREDLEYFLGSILYSYQDGWKPDGFPIEFGTEEYYKALESVMQDVKKRVDKRYGRCQ